ncbi:hypothetical protein L7F22_049860 [Adiantum nelumboides]|nr:hypothetical protein [Adiantum nelumboides]
MFICHGYSDTCASFYFNKGVARRLAKSGYTLFDIDYPRFGLPSGLHCYVLDFNRLVKDVIKNYCTIKGQLEVKKLSCFLFGESMGGTKALKSRLKQPKHWDGAVLVPVNINKPSEKLPHECLEEKQNNFQQIWEEAKWNKQAMEELACTKSLQKKKGIWFPFLPF